MSFENILAANNISASGLSAERLRLEVVANNIANANSTRTAQGGPFRRQNVVFAALFDQRLRGGNGRQTQSGVEVVDIVSDPSELPRVYNPGHPDADRNGFVTMPNVQLPIEMVNMITANRGYEANLKVLQAYRQLAEQTIQLLRS